MSPGKIITGHTINLKTTNSLHYGDNKARNAGKPAASFSDFLNGAINKVNDLQNNSDSLVQKMIYEPESVDIHSVMIAAQKAEITLSLTKSVRDEAIRAFRDIMNMR